MDKEAIEEAIEVLEDASAEMLTETGNENYYGEAIAVLRQALKTGFIDGVWYGPPQRKPLTDEQIIKHFQEHVDTGSLLSFADGVRFAEAAHGINP